MYIIRNKIRVICSKIRVGMEGGGSIFHRGGPYSPIEYGPRVHIQGGGVHIQYDTGPAVCQPKRPSGKILVGKYVNL